MAGQTDEFNYQLEWVTEILQREDRAEEIKEKQQRETERLVRITQRIHDLDKARQTLEEDWRGREEWKKHV